MADDVAIIAAELRLKLDEMENDALVAQKRMQHFAKEFAKQGENGGKLYVKGFNKGAADLNRRLNDFVGAMSGISPKMGALGDKMAKVFSKPIFAMVPAVSMAFQAMLPVIGTIIAAVAALMAGISKAAKAHKEFNDNVSLAKKAAQALEGETQKLTDRQQKNAELATRQQVAAAKVHLAFKNMGDFLAKIFNPVLDLLNSLWTTVLENLGKAAGAIGFILSLTPGFNAAGAALLAFAASFESVSEEEAKAARNAQILKNINNELLEDEKRYREELDNISIAEEAGAKTAEAAANSRLSVAESYLDSLIKLRNETAALVGETSKEVEAYDEAIKKQVEERDSLQALVERYEKLRKAKEEAEKGNIQEQIDKEREAAIAKYEQAVRRANDALDAGLIDQLEHTRQLAAAKAQEYSDLEAIVAKYDLIESVTEEMLEETVAMRDTLAEQVKLNQDNAAAMTAAKARLDAIGAAEKERAALLIDQEDTLKQQEIARAQEAGQIDLAIQLENELIEKQRQREREALEASLEKMETSEEETAEILANFDAITAGMKKLQEGAKETSLFDSEAFQQGVQIGEAAVSAFDSISSQALAISQKHAEEQIAIIDAALERTMEQIEEARQMELEAEGFIEAQSEEQIQKQIDAAKEAGDEVLQYQLERRMQEKEINDRYDAQAKAAEEKAAREKADIEYRVAKEEYALSLIQAANAGVMAVLNALQTKPFWMGLVMAGIAGTTAAAQIGLLAANPPKPPAFADGGIVPGRRGDGDVNHIIATAGELILNEAQQENVADKLTDAGEIVVNNYIMVNDEVIGKSSARYANTRGAVFEQRAIMGLR